MSTPLFDPHDPNWRCCCGCHVTLGTKIICGLSFAICAISAAATLAVTPGSFLPTFLWLLAVGALFLSPIYGVNKEKPYFLIPYLIISVSFYVEQVFKLTSKFPDYRTWNHGFFLAWTHCCPFHG